MANTALKMPLIPNKAKLEKPLAGSGARRPPSHVIIVAVIRISAATCFLGAAILFVMSLFSVKPHDWDIDAFLYLGSRLLHGEFLYIYDFETKLPPLQYIFALPSALGGIGVWRIMTLAISFTLGGFGSYIIARDFSRLYLPDFGTKSVTIFCFSLFLLLIYSLPGSRSAHIEMVAASAAYLSMALTISASAQLSISNLAYSALFLAVAACVRPNYFYVAAVFPAYILFCNIFTTTSIGASFNLLFKTWLKLSSLFFTFFLSAIVVLLLPYFLSNTKFTSLINGITAIILYSDGISIKRLVFNQISNPTAAFFIVIYVSFSFSIILITVRRFERSRLYVGYAIYPLLSVIAINVSLISSHYWQHNSIMFVPYIIPFLLIVMAKAFGNSVVAVENILMKLLLCLIFLGTMVSPYVQIFSYGQQLLNNRIIFSTKINDRNIDSVLLDYLSRQGKSFLVIDGPIYHMLLDERRIGDGHPSMLRSVLLGRRVNPVGDIYLYSKEVSNKPCLSLIRSEKSLIVIKKESRFIDIVQKCFRDEASNFHTIHVDGLSRYIIYSDVRL